MGYKLIQVEKLPPGQFSQRIRNRLNRKNIGSLEKAMEKGADFVRAYFNGPNLRKRKVI